MSIVIPYYNMHTYIDDTLRSVNESYYRNWEVIMVDDGSPSIEAQEKFIAIEQAYCGNPQYQFLRKPNGGLGSARNFGIRQSSGKYILPLDSDDVIHPQYINLAVQALERQKDLAAVSCYVSYFNDGSSFNQIIDYVIPYDLNPLLITLEDRAGVACSVFRKEVFDRFQYNEELSAFEDWELWWQMAEAGLKSETMPIILYRYRLRKNSMFHQTSPIEAAHLKYRISDLHSHYIIQVGVDVFRIYVAALAQKFLMEQQLRTQISNGSSGSLEIDQIYLELQTIKNSFSWKIIEKLRNLWLYHWMHPIYMRLKRVITTLNKSRKNM